MENYTEINYEKNMAMLERAYSFSRISRTHDEIMAVLASSDDLQKQLCLIELDALFNQTEADILVSNLTDNPGPVRETCSFKVFDLIQCSEYKKYFQTREILDSFSRAVTDINPSVSRNAVEIIKHVNDVDYIYNKIISEINKTLSEFNVNSSNHSYDTNKKNFNLYWNLEAVISLSSEIIPGKEIVSILNVTAASGDYTIREKTAKLLSVINCEKIDAKSALELLKNDENIYVRKYL